MNQFRLKRPGAKERTEGEGQDKASISSTKGQIADSRKVVIDVPGRQDLKIAPVIDKSEGGRSARKQPENGEDQ